MTETKASIPQCKLTVEPSTIGARITKEDRTDAPQIFNIVHPTPATSFEDVLDKGTTRRR
eukprot:CAMPEP_0115332188 /NCGR_PEP_ID=MMETSP0270-20121206/86709_1 /TAXON_ID=71861 /ORGANISM="Scrippsiella trochoidea, Strain CCMP3099" /LENGTH=59 /DNA_ID=CAMNT_0002753017 /DNA_START=108 /DNA_END=284 /DNA_ORIENTATION=-